MLRAGIVGLRNVGKKQRIAVPDDRFAYVANMADDTISVIDIEPSNRCRLRHFRELENLVDQIFPRWNRVEDWLREAESYSRAT